MAPVESESCPGCGIPRTAGPECPRCGIIYSRADVRRARLAFDVSVKAALEPPSFAPPVVPAAPVPEAAWEGSVDSARQELIVRAVAIPGALLLAWLITATGLGRWFARTFVGMWLHELGHALAAWLCALPAFPGPWATRVFEERSFVVGAMIGGLLAAGLYAGWKARHRPLIVGCGALLLLFVVGTFALSQRGTQIWFTFGGDAGAMLLGALGMTTINAGQHSRLTTGGLRWGFLILGALGLLDASRVWFAARADFAEIPFGAIEGVGASDATKLVDWYGWSETALVSRYVTLAMICFAAVAIAWAWGVRQALQALRER